MLKNNIPDVNTLVKKAAYDTKIVEIEKKLDQIMIIVISISLLKNLIS